MCAVRYVDGFDWRFSLDERRRILVVALLSITNSLAVFLAAARFPFGRLFPPVVLGLF